MAQTIQGAFNAVGCTFEQQLSINGHAKIGTTTLHDVLASQENLTAQASTFTTIHLSRNKIHLAQSTAELLLSTTEQARSRAFVSRGGKVRKIIVQGKPGIVEYDAETPLPRPEQWIGIASTVRIK